MDSLTFLLYRHFAQGEIIPAPRPGPGTGSAEGKADE